MLGVKVQQDALSVEAQQLRKAIFTLNLRYEGIHSWVGIAWYILIIG